MTLRLTAWRDSLLAKTALLFVLWLVLCIPLSEILGLIRERGDSQRSAAEELAQTHVGAQTLAAPYLLVPYVERWREPVRDDKGQITGEELRQRQDVAIVFPKTQTMQGALATQERYRGIFKVPFYRLTAKVQGEIPPFDVDSLPHSVEGSQIEVGGEAGAPVLVLSMSDLRGLEGAPQLEAAGQALTLERGLPRAVAQSALAAGSVQAALSGQALDTWQQGQALPYVLDMTLAGQSHLAVAPLGEDTTAQLSSSWPHPGFGGRFLAAERTVSDTGFEAHWRISSLTTQARAQLAAALKQEKAANLERLETFDVTLTQPVNVYSMSERAAKYGGLFIALVIMAAFMVELFKRLRLHPVQYGLVGLSIAVFFLLLLALSEKMAFAWAYAGAAAASVALLGLYFSAVLGGAQRGGALAAYVAVLYAALYGLLASENNALLLGALLMSGLKASAGVSWYPDDSSSLNDLMKKSDFAMYQVKTSNKGGISEFDKESYEKKQSPVNRKADDLDELLSRRDMITYNFQPIVDAITGDIYAYEAFMRVSLPSLHNPIEVLRFASKERKLHEIEKLTCLQKTTALI